jgi:6-phosphofructokinase 1
MAKKNKFSSLGVLTSGGDAQGMNAAVRAVVRTALYKGLEVYAIYQGYNGMYLGGDMIRKMNWDSVSGIMHKGGTEIGTARSQEFRTREGRLQAALNLVSVDIDHLVVIGGDGSLTGANLFREEWPSLIDELVKKKKITRQKADMHPRLKIVGLVGSIDNDMSGTDMTIGADTALKRIVDAVDMLGDTAASHQRTFVIEVMGRNCGYLALISAISTGADSVFIPEHPPEVGWEERLSEIIRNNRDAGKNDSVVIVAEGAKDTKGNPIKPHYIKEILEDRLGQDTRITILGHVQRGGSPSAFDRYMSTVLGYSAVEHILEAPEDQEPMMIGMRRNKITPVSLMESVNKTHSIYECINKGNYEEAIRLRGGSFKESLATFRTLRQASPKPLPKGKKQLKLAILNTSGPAPGMNMATRNAVRLGLDKGHKMLAIKNGFDGLVENHIMDMNWYSVTGWTSLGGTVLGTNRKEPTEREYYPIASTLDKNQIDGLLIIGGLSGYKAAYDLMNNRDKYRAFDIPIILVPSSINNNLPGSDFSIGADTAINNIVDAIDKIKESAVSSNRAFVVEVMGRYCGYLALMSGLATGAEKVYLHESGVTLKSMMEDVNTLKEGFIAGQRLALIIRNEYANPIYDTQFISSLFEEEGGTIFDVRKSILGHIQQGGNPSPFDRNIATRLTTKAINKLIELAEEGHNDCAFIGMDNGELKFTDLFEFPRMVDLKYSRPKNEWWLRIREIAEVFERYHE